MWQSIEAGEVDEDLAVASDGVRGTVLCNNGVLVHHLAVVGLQGHRDSGVTRTLYSSP